MTFEWDPIKAFIKLRKHGVSFDEATTALLDPLSKTALDPDHSFHERRFLTLGASWKNKLLAVFYTELDKTFALLAHASQLTESEVFMKKIKTESEDWGRPEYQRSDLGKLVRGKYANTELEFAELVRLLLVCIGEDEGIQFQQHPVGNYPTQLGAGDWTYEIDNSNQITLRYWLTEHRNVEQLISNPPVITRPAERNELQSLLLEHVRALEEKVGDRNTNS